MISLTRRKANNILFTNKNSVESVEIRDEIISFRTQRIIALWGFSEAAFGGILHALKIPFTGLFLGSAAVIFISLIAHYSRDKSAILRATLIVVLVKAFVSPYSPLTAYFAVALQGTLGYLFFSTIKYERMAALLLGFFSLFFSALQKLILLTLLFGTGLWNSIDLFVDFVLSQIQVLHHSQSFSFSLVIIALYTGLHIIVGIYVGIKSSLIPQWVDKKSRSFERLGFDFQKSEDHFIEKKKYKKRPWWRRSSGISLFVFLIVLMMLSYFFPQLGKNRAYDILFMMLRSIIITIIWFSILSPFILKHFKRFIEKNKFKHASEINNITILFPNFNRIINFCWKASAPLKGIKRIRMFLSNSLALLLFLEIK